MKETGRYEMAELQDIAECWGDYLEAVFIDEPPYDDRGISDFDDFCRRIAENVSFFEEEFAQGPERPYLEPEQASRQFELTKQRLSEWRRTATILAGKTEETINDYLRIAVERQCAAHWGSTFRRIREMRREGRLFPLRMPEFNVTEKGVELLRPLTPEQYAELYTRHRMDEMFRVMEEMGSEIWSPSVPPLGDSICQECAGHFDRQMITQIYCGERCRKRAKNRRWRERDPERARQCQAHYWKGYSDFN